MSDLEDLPAGIRPVKQSLLSIEDDEDDDVNPLDAMGVSQPKDVDYAGLLKPWMKYHRFEVVSTIEQLNEIVDKAIEAKICALDLETEGLDNRIYMHDPRGRTDIERWWDNEPEAVPLTNDKVVGYCLCYDGYTGYYAPVRHTVEEDLKVKPSPANLDIVQAGQAIRRLCLASQPVLTEKGREEDPLASRDIEVPGKLRIIFWNAKFDQEFLYPITGIDVWHPDSFEDGMIQYFVLYTGDKALSLKAKSDKSSQKHPVLDPIGLFIRDKKGNLVKEGGDSIPYTMIKLKELFAPGRKIHFPSLDPYEARHYACSDAICTYLHGVREDLQKAVFSKKYIAFYRIEKQVVQVVRLMERTRVRIDVEYTENLIAEAKKEVLEYHDEIVALAESYGFKNFDPNSPKQLSDFLFASANGLQIQPAPAKNEKSGQYKTDADTLEELAEHANANPVLLKIVKYRQVDKVIGTYLNNMLRNKDPLGEVPYQFKQVGAATGRFSAPTGGSGENATTVPIHGIPGTYDDKKPKVATALRRSFIARHGYAILKVDYSGEELRIVTNISKEPVWEKEFLEGSGDLHTITARAFFNKQEVSPEERQGGKRANFALVYGGGAMAVQRATGCDKSEGARRKAAFDKSVPVFARWSKEQKRRVKLEKGVKTAFGRWIAIPEVDHENPAIAAGCERKSINYPIQGCMQYNSLVLTSRGWRKIGELVSEGVFQAWTGTSWVDATAADMGPWQLAEVRLSDGSTVSCDTRHKLLQVTDEGYLWVDYESLQEGMAVATSLCHPVNFQDPFILPEISNGRSSINPSLANVTHEEVWYWLGRYMGDGWIAERGDVFICFGRHEQKAIAICEDFFRRLGLNPTTDVQTKPHGGHSVTVSAYSVDLVRWLKTFGFKPSTAHTKRIPSSAFNTSLAHRFEFLKGLMDSDGHRPSMGTAKGNPYNWHLCQRPLLEDLKLLLRSAGVESVIRGPYRSGTDVKGEPTTSYRLYVNRRMFDQQVLGVKRRGPKFVDLFAPQFLVDNFLSKGDFCKEDFAGDRSSHVMYSRLKHGGKVTVYTLERMCQLLKVALDYPLYGYKRVVSKKEFTEEETTYTLSVHDPLHRFEAEGVIQKNTGADVMKLAMILLHREFIKRGWIQDQTVRMMLTVHDEIVFEVKLERLMEVTPIIEEIMESPSKMIKWKVPLVAEALIGASWDAKYDFHLMVHGKESDKEPKKGQIRVGKKVYQAVPEFLAPYIIPDFVREGGVPEVPVPKAEVSTPAASPLAPTPQSASATPKQLPMPVSSSPVPYDESDVFTCGITSITRRSAQLLVSLIHRTWSDNGSILRLVDANTNEVLITPEMNFRVKKALFIDCLNDVNL